MDRAIAFRGRLISGGGCSFRAQITADYGQEVQHFALECEADEDGQISFSVIEPSTVEGITGVVQGDEGTITYDGLQLVFPLMVYGQISPVSAPALLASSWVKEFILSAGMDGNIYRASYEKKINDKVILIDTYFEKDIPISADLCYNGYTVMHMNITNFSFR